MQVMIVEDEKLLAKRLQNILHEVEPSAKVVAVTHSVEESVEWLQSNKTPDLILMDIELADGQSFDIFQKVEVESPVIFTTAYDEYAIKAFKVNSIDYLLKPIKEEELAAALDKFRKSNKQLPSVKNIEVLLSALAEMQGKKDFRSRFLVKQGQKMISIDTNDIAYIFSENGFSFIRTKDNQKYILDHSMDELEKELSPQIFFRANRQYILSQHSITGIHPWFNQKLKVEVRPETEEHVVISRDKANAFKAWMGE